MWQDNPHESISPASDVQTSHKLGSLLSSNRWQMQHEHLLQNVSSGLKRALHAAFLQTKVPSDLLSADRSGENGTRRGFSPFLGCFLQGDCVLDDNDGIWGGFFCSGLLDDLPFLITWSAILDFSEFKLFLPFTGQFRTKSEQESGYSCLITRLLRTSFVCPFFSVEQESVCRTGKQSKCLRICLKISCQHKTHKLFSLTNECIR